jgi:hypothetical protein
MSYSKNPHKTAITRKKVSLPIRKHLMGQLADPCKRRLDYGCGKGYDADRLGMFKYDPHFFPDTPAGEFDYIYCGYVLNVMSRKEGQTVIDNIQPFLSKRGIAYVVVRRGMKKAGFTKKGTYQRNVVLEGAGWPVKETSAYCVYAIRDDSKIKVK